MIKNKKNKKEKKIECGIQRKWFRQEKKENKK